MSYPIRKPQMTRAITSCWIYPVPSRNHSHYDRNPPRGHNATTPGHTEIGRQAPPGATPGRSGRAAG